MRKAILVGDTVQYTAKWCRSVGAVAGRIPHARGVVKGLGGLGGQLLVDVQWSDGHRCKVLSVNLKRVGAWEAN